MRLVQGVKHELGAACHLWHSPQSMLHPLNQPHPNLECSIQPQHPNPNPKPNSKQNPNSSESRD